MMLDPIHFSLSTPLDKPKLGIIDQLQFNAAIVKLDVFTARKFLRQTAAKVNGLLLADLPDDRLLSILHHARLNSPYAGDALRRASEEWLRQRGETVKLFNPGSNRV